MRITYILLLAVLGAAGQWRASAFVAPSTTNRVALTWGSLGPGTQYYVQTSTDLQTWTAATNTTATSVNLAFVGDKLRMFRLSVSNAPSPTATLAWAPPPTGADVVGYTIYYGVSPRNYTNQIVVGPGTAWEVSNLMPGTTYYFAATSHSSVGFESDFSSEVVWQTQSAPRLSIQKLP